MTGNCQALPNLSPLGCRPTITPALLLHLQGQVSVCRVHTGDGQAECCQLEQAAMHTSLSHPRLHLHPNNACKRIQMAEEQCNKLLSALVLDL